MYKYYINKNDGHYILVPIQDKEQIKQYSEDPNYEELFCLV